MKKLVLIILTFISFASFGQNVKFGVKGAYNLPEWNFTNETSFEKTSSGFLIGGLVDFGIIERASLRIEANYVSYAFNLSGSTGNGFDAAFIELPVLIRANIFNNFHSYFGFGLGFKMSSSAFMISTEPAYDDIPIMANYKDEYLAPVRVFLPFGLSYDFKNGLFLDVRMNLNLNNLDTKSVDFVKGINSYNFGIGYTFAIPKKE